MPAHPSKLSKIFGLKFNHFQQSLVFILFFGHQEEVLNVKFHAKTTGKHSIKTQRFQVYVFDLKPK